MTNYSDLIEFTTVDELKIRLKSLPFACKVPNRKADMTKQLLSTLMDLDKLTLILNNLSSVQQLALQEAVHNQNGYVNALVFEAKYQQAHPSQAAWSHYQNKGNQDDKLLYPFFYATKRYGSAVCIPDDLRLFIKPHIPLPPKFYVKTNTRIDSEKSQQQETAQFTQSEFNHLINTIKDKKLKVSPKTGLPSKALLKKLSLQLNEPYQQSLSIEDDTISTIKAFGWIQILRAASWIKEANGELQINVKKLSLKQRHCDIVKALFWDWKAHSTFDELSRIKAVKGQKGKAQRYLTAPEMRREECIATLTQCPTGEWVAFDDFIRLMTATNHFFDITLYSSSLYIGDSVYGRLHDDRFLTSVYTRCLLLEYFATLGLIDIAYVEPDKTLDNYANEFWLDEINYLSAYDGLTYLRLTKLGAYVLGMTHSYSESFASSETPITMLPKFGVQFLQQPTANEKVFLTHYADEQTKNFWQLSVSKLLSHLENGGELAEVHDFLMQRDEQPYFPTDTEHLFKTLAQNKVAVTLEGRVLLLQCSGEAVAKNIACAPIIKKWCKRVGKDQLIIPEGKESVFRKLIHELKYAMPIKS
ncbi:hypothetical protein CJF42_10345 [Pseudoalteromonas sp. NBT06-2]|uniref:hypothetical protein n=1 Tax=Pseudoalteromonas sp. NBT06-2 TaxID=2025950 RepID=UPI000BA588AC|nr:hypothetical protein [Pseudoalteromonas sp. NBT06-2]PAJ74497.1 hypothetical protein CJF42_10345 [Pseudoalteromonas sp. NBT06-2]